MTPEGSRRLSRELERIVTVGGLAIYTLTWIWGLYVCRYPGLYLHRNESPLVIIHFLCALVGLWSTVGFAVVGAWYSIGMLMLIYFKARGIR